MKIQINRLVTSNNILLLLIIGISLILQVAAAQQKSLWGDEVFTINYAQMAPAQLEKALPPHQQPLYYEIARFWGELIGFDKLAMRFSSIVFVGITLFFTFLLGKDLFGEKAALLSVAILGLSPLLLLHGHNVRYYSLISALATLMAFSSYRYWKKRQWVYLLPYIGAGTLMLYILFTSVSFLIGVIVWWFIYILFDKRRQIDYLLLWIAAQGVILALWLPAFTQVQGFTQSYLTSFQLENGVVEFLKRFLYSGYVFSIGGTISPLNPVAWIGIEVIALTFLFSFISFRKNIDAWMPVFFTIWNIFTAVLLTFLSAEHSLTWQNLAHWFLYILPFFSLWLGAGLVAFNRKILVTFCVLLLLVYSFGNMNYFLNRQFIQGVYAIPWENIFEMIKDEGQPEAMVICTSLESSCWYYGNKYGMKISTPEQINSIGGESVKEIWWIYTNIGNLEYENQELYQSFLKYANDHFTESQVFKFVQQDPSIRWLKSKLFRHNDYEYQVNVYHFRSPRSD